VYFSPKKKIASQTGGYKFYKELGKNNENHNRLY